MSRVRESAAHALLVLRTAAVGGLCRLATTSDTLVKPFERSLQVMGRSVMRHQVLN